MKMPEAIVLAGGEDARLNPLTNAEHPKCLLPVANSPAILYSLMALKNAGITSIFVVRADVSAVAAPLGCAHALSLLRVSLCELVRVLSPS